MRGKPRAAPELKVLRGTFKKAREAARAAARDPLPVAVPSCPDIVKASPIALGEWTRVTRLLKRRGTINALDRAMLTAYAVAVATYHEAQAKIAELGLVVKSPTGFPIVSPFLGVRNRAYEQIHKLGREFGLSPASRGPLKTQAPAPKATPTPELKDKTRFFDPARSPLRRSGGMKDDQAG